MALATQSVVHRFYTLVRLLRSRDFVNKLAGNRLVCLHIVAKELFFENMAIFALVSRRPCIFDHFKHFLRRRFCVRENHLTDSPCRLAVAFETLHFNPEGLHVD